MLRRHNLLLCLLGLAAVLHIMPYPARAQDPMQDPPKSADRPVKIGMVDSLFTDVNPIMVKIGSAMFATLMKATTDMDGEMVIGGHALTVGKELHDGKLDLGVFHGVEFAWAQQRYPDLRPLMVAITRYPHAQALIVVPRDSTFNSFHQLQGKHFVMPLCSREHSRQFLSRCCLQCGHTEPNKFFGKVVKLNCESALDEVSYGKMQAVVVDAVSLEKYQALKPGYFNRLRVLKASEHFPTGVIAYREGSLREDVLAKFRNGLINAASTDLGKEMMQGFQITAFEPVPANYSQALADILKIYPAPSLNAPR